MIKRIALVLMLVGATACRPAEAPNSGNTDLATNTNTNAEVVDTSQQVPYDFSAVDFVDISHGWVIGHDEGNNVSAILWTANGGANWTVAVEIVGDTLLDVDFADDRNGWAVGTEGVVYASTDGGKTWAPDPASSWDVRYTKAPVQLKARGEGNIAPTINESIASVFFVDEKTGWAGGDAPTGENFDVRGMVLGTTDGGKTWAELKDAAGKGAPYSVNDLWFTSATDGWAAAGTLEDHQEDVLMHTADGGLTWDVRQTKTAQYLRAVQFVDEDHGWIVGLSETDDDTLGPSKVLTTATRGSTWEVEFTSPRSFYDVTFADPMHGWAVGDRATVYQTADGGRHWRQQTKFATTKAPPMTAPRADPKAPRRALRSLFARDATSVWAAGDGVILQKK